MSIYQYFTTSASEIWPDVWCEWPYKKETTVVQVHACLFDFQNQEDRFRSIFIPFLASSSNSSQSFPLSSLESNSSSSAEINNQLYLLMSHQLQLVSGCQLVTIGQWLSVSYNWSVVVGQLQLVSGGQLVTVGQWWSVSYNWSVIGQLVTRQHILTKSNKFSFTWAYKSRLTPLLFIEVTIQVCPCLCYCQ